MFGNPLRRQVASRSFLPHVEVKPTALQARWQHSQTASSNERPSSSNTTTPPPGNKAKSPRQTRRSFFLAVTVSSIVAGGVYGAWYGDTGAKPGGTLNKSTFTPFFLVKKEKVSSTNSIFTLESPDTSGKEFEELWKTGIWSIEIKQPQLQIARAYTPLPPSPSAAEDELRLLVRRERNGEVSNYIHSTPLEGSLELRGPSVEYKLPENVQEVVFLAGGTGIAPALQVAHALRGKAKVSILWGNRLREDCLGGKNDTATISNGGWFPSLGQYLGASKSQELPEDATQVEGKGAIVEHLEQLKSLAAADSSKALTVDYFVDEEGTFIKAHVVRTAVSLADSAAAATSSGRKLLFVSGPEGFINYWAGPKQWANGREVQGPLGGMLAQMNLPGWEVIKL
ncbi:hypothetical protein M8818_005923 [Zalaria obscura]|uniref:Uncharacterized protein n=1 Tax=Zalaria obscura TaxID=2024903 RepID=A0ACC3S8A3_9PEZI